MVTDVPNPTVSTALLTEILQWKDEGCKEAGIVERLRRTVPNGYEYLTWQPGNVLCFEIFQFLYSLGFSFALYPITYTLQLLQFR